MADPETWIFKDPPEDFDDYWWYNDRLSERKRYLFMAAIGRLIVHWMDDSRCIRSVAACEEYAEGIIDSSTFVQITSRLTEAGPEELFEVAAVQAPLIVTTCAHEFMIFLADDGKLNECVDAAEAAFGFAAAAEAGDVGPVSRLYAYEAHERFASFREGAAKARRTFLAHCLDVFGANPFRTVTFDPAWRSETAVTLARLMYESRDFSAMPILADALQDTGCECHKVLTHCRDPKDIHVRGCWVVDLVLGKS